MYIKSNRLLYRIELDCCPIVCTFPSLFFLQYICIICFCIVWDPNVIQRTLLFLPGSVVVVEKNRQVPCGSQQCNIIYQVPGTYLRSCLYMLHTLILMSNEGYSSGDNDMINDTTWNISREWTDKICLANNSSVSSIADLTVWLLVLIYVYAPSQFLGNTSTPTGSEILS